MVVLDMAVQTFVLNLQIHNLNQLIDTCSDVKSTNIRLESPLSKQV